MYLCLSVLTILICYYRKGGVIKCFISFTFLHWPYLKIILAAVTAQLCLFWYTAVIYQFLLQLPENSIADDKYYIFKLYHKPWNTIYFSEGFIKKFYTDKSCRKCDSSFNDINSAAALFKLKRLAVGAGNNGRIIFVSSYLNFFKTAVIITAAVMLAIVYCTFDRLVCKFCSHNDILL